MKKNLLAIFILSSMLVAGCSSGNDSGYADPSVNMQVREIAPSTSDVNKMLSSARSAVVGIAVDLSDGYAIGTGVAISSGGYILTNFHVVEGGNAVKLYFADKTTGSAEIVWGNPGLDMAILKSSREIPYLSTRNLGDVLVGDEVYAIGTPLTLEFKHTITKGVVSAMDRTLESESSYGVSYLQSLIQHDASINPGNSGGPLINGAGQVIGINTLKASEGEGIGFAIPIELGKVIVDKIRANENYSSPYLGIFGFDSALASVYGDQAVGEGVYIVSTKDSAKKAGLKKGDIIVGVDDEKIANMLDFRIAIYKHDIGDSVKIKYIRGDSEAETEILLKGQN